MATTYYYFEKTTTKVKVKELLQKFKENHMISDKQWGLEIPEYYIYPVAFGIVTDGKSLILKGYMYTLKEPKTGTKYMAVLDDICLIENGVIFNLNRKKSKFVSMLGIVEFEEIITDTYRGKRFTWTDACF